MTRLTPTLRAKLLDDFETWLRDALPSATYAYQHWYALVTVPDGVEVPPLSDSEDEVVGSDWWLDDVAPLPADDDRDVQRVALQLGFFQLDD